MSKKRGIKARGRPLCRELAEFGSIVASNRHLLYQFLSLFTSSKGRQYFCIQTVLRLSYQPPFLKRGIPSFLWFKVSFHTLGPSVVAIKRKTRGICTKSGLKLKIVPLLLSRCWMACLFLGELQLWVAQMPKCGTTNSLSYKSCIRHHPLQLGAVSIMGHTAFLLWALCCCCLSLCQACHQHTDEADWYCVYSRSLPPLHVHLSLTDDIHWRDGVEPPLPSVCTF